MSRRYSRSHANRGMRIERLVDMANNEYRNKGVADIRKIPTPVKIMKASGGNVTGHTGRATWVDYSGICEGRAIIFDAKETRVKNFPLRNVAAHQYELLKSWHAHGAAAFLLIAFWIKDKNEPEIYVLPFHLLQEAWDKSKEGGAKSIPLKFFQDSCARVVSQGGITIDYLDALLGT